jgi:hypothetical protein
MVFSISSLIHWVNKVLQRAEGMSGQYGYSFSIAYDKFGFMCKEFRDTRGFSREVDIILQRAQDLKH